MTTIKNQGEEIAALNKEVEKLQGKLGKLEPKEEKKAPAKKCATKKTAEKKPATKKATKKAE